MRRVEESGSQNAELQISGLLRFCSSSSSLLVVNVAHDVASHPQIQSNPRWSQAAGHPLDDQDAHLNECDQAPEKRSVKVGGNTVTRISRRPHADPLSPFSLACTCVLYSRSYQLNNSQQLI
jgi:hypothetical protein